MLSMKKHEKKCLVVEKVVNIHVVTSETLTNHMKQMP
jgi:hypothetical protein